jgi:hypothetical protein
MPRFPASSFEKGKNMSKGFVYGFAISLLMWAGIIATVIAFANHS